MTGDWPSDAGGAHERSTWELPAVAVRPAGGPGGSPGRGAEGVRPAARAGGAAVMPPPSTAVQPAAAAATPIPAMARRQDRRRPLRSQLKRGPAASSAGDAESSITTPGQMDVLCLSRYREQPG